MNAGSSEHEDLSEAGARPWSRPAQQVSRATFGLHPADTRLGNDLGYGRITAGTWLPCVIGPTSGRRSVRGAAC